MDRRRFLASAAATAIAPSCLAQPARVEITEIMVPGGAALNSVVYIGNRLYMFTGQNIVRWSDQEDHNDWSPA